MKSGISFFLFVFESIFLVFIGSRLLIFFVFGTDLSNYSEWICIDALLHCFSYSDLIDFPNWNNISLIFNFFSLSFILPLNPHTFRLPFITYNYSSLFFFFSVATIIWSIHHILTDFFIQIMWSNELLRLFINAIVISFCYR